ncbi:bifunctional riboflavin kinase/FAD synthetase [Anaplasmataceae bacterium AB001_6]|nr:bifunctional riboflavin kinase/FAD synthetase [Anaplasmataceae bacterium AB001_6]
MKIFRKIRPISNLKTVVTFGNFDGVHFAHQNIFKIVSNLAKEKGLLSVILTFNNHPKTLLLKESDFLIYDNTTKMKLLKEQDCDYLYLLDFDESFSKIESEDFISEILIKKLNMKFIVQGYNCRFGTNGKGSNDMLRSLQDKYKYNFQELNELTIAKETCSSSNIRKYLKDGEPSIYNKMLNRIFEISNKVIEGNKRGRLIGFPTANIKIDAEQITPKKGVYKTYTIIDQKIYSSITNVGTRPTFDNKPEIIIETHIFNFDADIYGKDISVGFEEFIREEMKFNSLEELKKQIIQDIESVKKLHSLQSFQS